MKLHIRSINPADGSLVWEGPAASVPDIEHAAARARRALADWSSRTFEERAGVLRRFAEVLEDKSEELAILIAQEIGKPLWEARTEVSAMAGKVEISISAHETRCHEFPGGKARTRFRPHGVLVVLGPYNFPGHLPNGHICPALLAGNVVLFKPSDLAPATADFTCSCWLEAGLPGEVLQLVQGGPETAENLVGHAEVDGVLFTGSARTGKLLARRFAETPGKVLALEMGGNNPLIVDSGHIGDLSAAATVTLHSAFLSAGQRCTCARRLILVESGSSGPFLDELLQQAAALVVDDPFADPQPFMGPLASPDFPARILQAQQKLLDSGGHGLLQARSLRPGTGFLTPAVLDVGQVRNLPDEEVFGPLLQLIRVPDLEEAVRSANRTRYGLASGILTDDDPRFEYAFARLRAGIINRNVPLTGASSAAPFGGIGDSGNLRPSAFFAADYCSYPVASISSATCQAPAPLPG